MASKKKPNAKAKAPEPVAPRRLPPPPPPKKPRTLSAKDFGIEAPEHLLGDIAIKEFNRVVVELKGAVRPVDMSLVVDYALVYQDCILLRQKADSEPEVLEGAKGGSYVNPIQNLLISKQTSCAALRRDLYFTPKSRAEKVKSKGKAQSILEALKSGKSADEVPTEGDRENWDND